MYHKGIIKSFYCWHGVTNVWWWICSALGAICSNILLHLEVTQMVVKLLLRATQISITNTYILYVKKWNKINSKPMSHTEFRRQLAMALVGDDSPDRAASTVT